MNEYIMTVATAAVIAAIVDLLSPKEWNKYIRIVIGFLILAIMFAPIATFQDSYIFSPTASYDIDEAPFYDGIYKELKKNIEADISARLLEEFSVEATVNVDIDVDEDYNIRGVRVIQITAVKNPKGMIERLREVYGCDKIELRPL